MEYTREYLMGLSPEALREVPREELVRVAQEVQAERLAAQQERQLWLYQPVSEEAGRVHGSVAREIVATGGNRSGKSELTLVELVIQLTGVVPFSLEGRYPKEKLRAPIRARLVCESITTTWEPVLKPKLQWHQWSGTGEPGSGGGHWGWIPRQMLPRGSWEEAWNEKYRTLHLTNGSTLQVMSFDQKVESAAGASLHVVVHDEGPPRAMYRESRVRTMDVKGRCYIAFTPPDEERAAWDAAWVYDELYLKGLPGLEKDPDIEAFTLLTEDNRVLDKGEIERLRRRLSPMEQEVRLHGRFLHLAGRIYQTYTDREAWWCWSCGTSVMVEHGACVGCDGREVGSFSHVIEPFEIPASWPVVYVLDPHPRKPHAMAWYAISPGDDVYEVAELEVDGEPAMVRDRVDAVEREMGGSVALRLIDPNMGQSPAGQTRRGVTVREEFDAVGLRCRLADDNRATGRSRIREWLKPDQRTKAPRLQIFRTCMRTNFQMLRYVWDNYTRYGSDERNPKPVPRDLHDDFPTLLSYLANESPTYGWLAESGQRRTREVRAY